MAPTAEPFSYQTMPFTSIVGQEEMKSALILNAINPRIGGVLIRGDKGTAKSTAVRALADLLEEMPVVDGCPFNCDPHNPEEMCDLCYDKNQQGQIKLAKQRTPVVDLPLGATEDRVVGSLDVERAIKEGIKDLEPGILAAANRGCSTLWARPCSCAESGPDHCGSAGQWQRN